MQEPLESDWKTFRKRVPEWRERYLSRTTKEVLAILIDEEKTPTERFWDAEEKMKAEAEILVKCLDGHSRSNMSWALSLMYRHGLVGKKDLKEFSDELREWVLAVSRA